jgi:hypothetical protein
LGRGKPPEIGKILPKSIGLMRIAAPCFLAMAASRACPRYVHGDWGAR